MKEYIVPILEFLGPPKAVPRIKPFETILEGAGEIKLNPIAETKLKEFLIYNRLIEKYSDPFENESIVLPKKYIISDYGKEVLIHIRYLRNLDSITYWLFDDFLLNGGKASYHSIEEICTIKKIEYSIHYDADIVESGLVENVESQDGNAWKIRPMAYKVRLRENENFHVNKYLDEILAKTTTPTTNTTRTTKTTRTTHIEYRGQIPPIVPHNTTHNIYNIQDTKGNVFTGDKNKVKDTHNKEKEEKSTVQKVVEIAGIIVTLAATVWGVYELISK